DWWAWKWNFGIRKRRPIAVRECRQWKPAVAYCRYADDFTLVVKRAKAHAQEVREVRRAFLEGKLKTHVVEIRGNLQSAILGSACMNQTRAVIIGAGPAGSTAAVLALGLLVLMYRNRHRVP